MKSMAHPSRRCVIGTLLFAASVVAAGNAFAYDENSPAPINVDAGSVALKGYDPVSYFEGAGPVKGKESLAASHEGAVYHFASTGNRDKFIAAPGTFAPQFGGFCAMGVALDKKLDVDPTAYRVVNGKLYLNVNKDVQKRWLDDVPGNIATAESKWPTLRDKLPKDL